MMATMGQSGLAARQLEPLFGRGTVSGLSEGQLDCRFSMPLPGGQGVLPTKRRVKDSPF